MVVVFCSLILAVTAFVQSSPTTDASGDTLKSERDLRRDLFHNYDIYSRPVKKWSSCVPVEISMSPLRVKSLNEKDQQISIEAWMKWGWTDEYLRWDPSEYDNISVIHVPPSKVWKPDIALYGASPDTYLFPTAHTQVLVFNTGKLLWVPPYTINSRCPIPFRSNTNAARAFIECNIRMGSWTYSTKMMDLQLSEGGQVDLTNFQDFHHDWKLVKIVANREAKYYPCCPDEYAHVNFNVTLKRRPTTAGYSSGSGN